MNQSNNDSPKQFGLFSVIRGVDADTAEIKSTEIIILYVRVFTTYALLARRCIIKIQQ